MKGEEMGKELKLHRKPQLDIFSPFRVLASANIIFSSCINEFFSFLGLSMLFIFGKWSVLVKSKTERNHATSNYKSYLVK